MEKKIQIANDSLLDRMFEDVQRTNIYVDRAKFSKERGCAETVRTRDKPDIELDAGYESLRSNTFYLQPDIQNSFHNYPVRQEDGRYCSQNHQVFNNFTRRKIAIKPEVKEEDLSDIIREDEPMMTKFSSCKILLQN